MNKYVVKSLLYSVLYTIEVLRRITTPSLYSREVVILYTIWLSYVQPCQDNIPVSPVAFLAAGTAVIFVLAF